MKEKSRYHVALKNEEEFKKDYFSMVELMMKEIAAKLKEFNNGIKSKSNKRVG